MSVPEFDISEILRTIATRSAAPGQPGIAAASWYVKSLVPCLSGSGLCPTQIFNLSSADLWSKELEESERRLTYFDPDSEIDTKGIKTSGLSTPNAIMEFDGTLITSDKDREGDIFEVKGANVDPKMPVLWNHIQLHPLGPVTKTLVQNDSRLSLKHVLLDVSLARDAAVLIEAKALRLSPGFLVRDAEPLTRSKNAQPGEPFGWRIKKADVVESSLVSVPANAGAIITAFEKKKLSDPLVKSLAKLLSENRNKVHQVPADIPAGETKSMDGDDKGMEGTCHKCGELKSAKAKTCAEADCPCRHKNVEPQVKAVDVGTKMVGSETEYLPGSYEQVTADLTRTAPDFLRSKGVDLGESSWCYMIATFADRAITCCYRQRKCYQSSYEIKDGRARWSGDPKEVSIQPVVVEKRLDEFISKSLDTKAGRVLSKVNADKLAAVRNAIDDLLKSAGCEDDKNCGEGHKKDDEKRLEINADNAVRALVAKSVQVGGREGIAVLESARKTLSGMIAHANEQYEAAELERSLAELGS